jgi:hypothetical protein
VPGDFARKPIADWKSSSERGHSDRDRREEKAMQHENVAAVSLLTAVLSLALGTVILTTGTANAAIIPVSQARSVNAAASAVIGSTSDTDSDSATAPGFGSFSDQATASALVAPATAALVASGDGNATQASDHGSTFVNASGGANGSLTLSANSGSASATGNSLFELVFTLDGPATYSLTGDVDTLAIVTGGAAIPTLSNNVSLEDVVSSTILFQTLTEDEAFTLSGSLPVGTYRLVASANASANQQGSASVARTVFGESTFSFQFTVADQNGTPLPEPSGLFLFALAFLSLLAMRRQARETARRA